MRQRGLPGYDRPDAANRPTYAAGAIARRRAGAGGRGLWPAAEPASLAFRAAVAAAAAVRAAFIAAPPICDTDRGARRNCDTRPNPGSGRDPGRDANRHTDGDPDRYAIGYPDPDPDRYANADGDADARFDGHGNTNCDTDRRADGDSDGPGNGYREPTAQRIPERERNGHARPERVTVAWFD